MNAAGWTMLIVSWGTILWLTAFAVSRTLRAKPRELSAPLEIEAEIEAEDARREDAGEK